MAVTTTLTLPGQPDGGLAEYVPLGGDGHTAPLAAWMVWGMTDTGDASGGNATLAIVMDPRYTALVSYVALSIRQGTAADADFRARISPQGAIYPTGSDFWGETGVITSVSSTVTGTECNTTLTPVPVMLRQSGDDPQLAVQFVNVNGDVYFLNCLIYLWDINVRQETPMGTLLFARGSN